VTVAGKKTKAGGLAEVDVAIAGAGLAGAVLALALARKGISVAVVEPNAEHRFDFRCEKLSPAQIALMESLGVLDAAAPAVSSGLAINDTGFHYEALVNAVRRAWPASVRLILDRVSGVATRGEGAQMRQELRSETGPLVRARLAVLATGLSPTLAADLGLARRIIREHQSVAIGFSLERKDGRPLDFAPFVHRGERAGDGVGFASLFHFGGLMRVNLFCYRDPGDPWLRETRADPLAAAPRVAPGLAGLFSQMAVSGPVEMRATTLYRTEGLERPGLVAIGDAFQTSCPATSFGVTRLLTDVQRLVDEHLPAWLATPGMGNEKIAAFYADPVKQATDAWGLRRADRDRAVATRTDPLWRTLRLAASVKRRAQALRKSA
jgi:2-polyprenyl-6-methoxyphenol hydroxylase-like FAD-dependent oxidoreductase